MRPERQAPSLARAPSGAAPAIDRCELFGGAVRCWQPRRGYRFSVDALLLAMAAFDPPAPDVAEETALELGAGVGVVLLVLALNPRFRRLVGLELQPALAALARRNVAEAACGDRVRIVEGDLRAPPPSLAAERFDLVVANPPYYPVGAGLLNPDGQRAIARHEIARALPDVLARARAAVRDGGRVVLVYPAPRAEALVAGAGRAGLAVDEVRLVRSRAGYAPRQALVALRPWSGAAPPPPPREAPVLDLHDENGAHVGPLADFFQRIRRLAPPPDGVE